MRKLAGRAMEDNGSEVNLTPMLDVVFIMLIFFIVTATFVKEVGLDINQPDLDQPKTINPENKSIVVRISAFDRIKIGPREIDIRSVRANIERLHAQNPEAAVVVVPHYAASTETIVGVMDAARQADVYNIQLAPPPKE